MSSEPTCNVSEYFEIRPPQDTTLEMLITIVWIHSPIPKPNSRLIIVGSRGCDKQISLKISLTASGSIQTQENQSLILSFSCPLPSNKTLITNNFTQIQFFLMLLCRNRNGYGTSKKITDQKP